MITRRSAPNCFLFKDVLFQQFPFVLFFISFSRDAWPGSPDMVTCYHSRPYIHTSCICRCRSFRRTYQLFHMFLDKSMENCFGMSGNFTNALCILGMVYEQYCGNMLAIKVTLDKKFRHRLHSNQTKVS